MTHTIKNPLIAPKLRGHKTEVSPIVVDYADWEILSKTTQAAKLGEHKRSKGPYNADAIAMDGRLYMVYGATYAGIGASYLSASELIPVAIYDGLISDDPVRAGFDDEGNYYAGLKCRVGSSEYITGRSVRVYSDIPRSSASVTLEEAKAFERNQQRCGGWRALEYAAVLPRWHHENGYILSEYRKNADDDGMWSLYYRDAGGRIQDVRVSESEIILALPAIASSPANPVAPAFQEDLFASSVAPVSTTAHTPDPQAVATIIEILEAGNIDGLRLDQGKPFIDARESTGVAIPIQCGAGVVLVRYCNDFHLQLFGRAAMSSLDILISGTQSASLDAWGIADYALVEELEALFEEWQNTSAVEGKSMISMG